MSYECIAALYLILRHKPNQTGMLVSAFGSLNLMNCPVRLLRGFKIFSRFALFQLVNISGLDPTPDHNLSPQ